MRVLLDFSDLHKRMCSFLDLCVFVFLWVDPPVADKLTYVFPGLFCLRRRSGFTLLGSADCMSGIAEILLTMGIRSGSDLKPVA